LAIERPYLNVEKARSYSYSDNSGLGTYFPLPFCQG
jgi:hypothetical protein